MKEKYKKVVQSCKTRWNSEYDMIRSVLTMQNTLLDIRRDPGYDPGELAKVIPEEDYFMIINELVPVFQKLTELMYVYNFVAQLGLLRLVQATLGSFRLVKDMLSLKFVL